MAVRLVWIALVCLLLPARSGAQCQPEPRRPLAVVESVRQVVKGPSNIEAIAFESPVLESASRYDPILRAVVAPRRAVSNALNAVIEAWTEVLRWHDEPLQLKRGVASWLGLRPPASPKTIEGLTRALDDPDLDTRLYARYGLDRALKSMERAATSPAQSPQGR